jgi:hypothetical protein
VVPSCSLRSVPSSWVSSKFCHSSRYSRLTGSVGIRGMMAPRITIETVMQLKVFSEKLIKIRKAWGALSMTSDGMVVVTSM